METSTPNQKSKSSSKRELSSPLDATEIKKSKASDSLNGSAISVGNEQTTTQVMLTSENLLFISNQLATSFRTEMSVMIEDLINKLVPSIIQNVHTELQGRLQEVETENNALRLKVSQLENEADRAQQYSRRNCLRVSGVPEVSAENTDTIILNMAAAIGSDLTLDEIDRSHRVGAPKQNQTAPRDIIVKFISYRARQKMYTKRASLKAKGHTRTFINEDLTKNRSSLLYQARQLVKQKSLLSAWSSDGTVLAKDNHGRVHVINSADDITRLRPLSYAAAVQAPAQAR